MARKMNMLRKINTSLGEITFDLTFKKVKRMNLRIKSGDIVPKVSAPIGVSVQTIDDFVARNAEFVFKNLQKSQKKREFLQNNGLKEIFLIGKPYQLVFQNGESFKLKIEDDKIYLFGNGDENKMILQLKKRVAAFAKKYMQQRFDFYKEQFNLPKEVSLKFSLVKSWWGKCNVTKKEISLNLKLISRPKAAIDGVICHEIAHLKVANHQKAFYNQLQKLDPNFKVHRAMLKGDKYLACDKLFWGK